MIQNVEELGSELDIKGFRDSLYMVVLEQGEIEVDEARSGIFGYAQSPPVDSCTYSESPRQHSPLQAGIVRRTKRAQSGE